MTEITKYMADDGKIFEFEDECREYEMQSIAQNMAKYGLKIWKQAGMHYVPVLANSSGLSCATIISVSTSEAVDFLERMGDETGFSVPHEIGEWYYDEAFEEWCNYATYHNAIEAFKFLKEQRQD